MIRLLILALTWTFWPTGITGEAAPDSLCYDGTIHAQAGSGRMAPSLHHANRYGDISLSSMASTLYLGLEKPMTNDHRWFDYGFGVRGGVILQDTRQNIVSHVAQPYIHTLYGHVRLYIFDLMIGNERSAYGPMDSELSMGNLLISSNARTPMQVHVGIDRWTAFPGLFGYLEVKGGISEGWLGTNRLGEKETSKVKLHHLYGAVRLGGRLPVNIAYELHDAAQWGGYSSEFGDLGNSARDWLNMVLGRSGGTQMSDQINVTGNHLVSQILSLTAKGDEWNVTAYWQNINEDGPIKFIGLGMNREDGLWGIRAEQSRWPYISGATVEVLHTTDQSGPWHDRDGLVYGGNDSYYANYFFPEGWRYDGRIIGNPLLTQDNNRVMAVQAGLKGDIFGFRWRAIYGSSRHYGTYEKRLETHNNRFLLEVNKVVPQAWGLEFGASVAGDIGTQYGNNIGAMITIRKRGLAVQWQRNGKRQR